MKDKIEGYTPGPWRVSTKDEFVHTGKDYHQIIALDGPRSNGPGFSITGCININDAQLIALAPTLYEQHFKMLEALKEIKENLSVRDVGPVSKDIIITICEQTIKDCEL